MMLVFGHAQGLIVNQREAVSRRWGRKYGRPPSIRLTLRQSRPINRC